jgi:hypothetical protein
LETQIVWNWDTVSDATGYKWSAVNNYDGATDMGTATTKTETGLTCNTDYTRYVWAYSPCGNSTVLTITQATSACPFSCSSSITINHVAGVVAPVSKTVTYGIVTNIPGEPSKCWITSNLGADHQATAVDDATEASAGWHWQFNRKQGYKHDGTTRTPSTAWINPINENSDWQAANDPCAIEIGTGWRIPTSTEWTNVDAAGNWTSWNGPWNSALKLHAAGYLYYLNGTLLNRGSYGYYRSGTQLNSILSPFMYFNNSYCVMGDDDKSSGFTLRCLQDPPVPSTTPTVTTSSVTGITQTTATGGGNVTADGGATVTARGVCWSTTTGPLATGSHTTDAGTTGSYTSSLTGLTAGTPYYVRAYATNSVGTAYGNELSFTTEPVFSCGSSLTINHLVSGGVAPVDKTVTYGTVTNVPGATTKCWITSNLGADHQATAVSDATEASAGWYWQFNRKQGYKHNGTTVTPSWTITSISETSDWTTANDPCTLELGAGWRIPTYFEWMNVNWFGNWTNWNGPWNSTLKMHAAGYLSYSGGSLYSRGTIGIYWSSSQNDIDYGIAQSFYDGASSQYSDFKAFASSIRCLQDIPVPPALPTATTSSVTNITQISATGGGNVTADGGATITARGVCWSITTSPVATGSHTTDAGTIGSFTSSLAGLTAGTPYYVRAYATNSVGTAYGAEVNFTTSPVTFSIGQSYGGGIIFYIDGSGQHGLIAATSDQSTGAQWGCWGTTISGADGTAIGTGGQNTLDLMAGCTTAEIAARFCNAYTGGGYNDWFLPSKDELNQMYLQKTIIGGFADTYYWSSSEYTAGTSWYQNFANGVQNGLNKNYTYNVRAIRAF